MALRTMLCTLSVVALLAACAPANQTADNETVPAANETAPATEDISREPARTQAPPAPVMATVPAGTVFTIELDTDLSSGTNQVGDPFTARLASPVIIGGNTLFPSGTMVHGEVTHVRKAKRGAGQAELSLDFSEIHLPDGHRAPIAATLSEQSESQKKRNAAVIGGSAAGGALLGGIIGKDTKGAVVGSMIGGAIGTGVVLSKEGEQVELPAGTLIDVELAEPVEVPRA